MASSRTIQLLMVRIRPSDRSPQRTLLIPQISLFENLLNQRIEIEALPYRGILRLFLKVVWNCRDTHSTLL